LFPRYFALHPSEIQVFIKTVYFFQRHLIHTADLGCTALSYRVV